MSLILWVTAFIILLSIGLLGLLAALLVIGGAVRSDDRDGEQALDSLPPQAPGPGRRLVRILLRRPVDLLIERRRDDSV